MSVAGDIESGGAFTIPDYSLQWIHAVYTVFQYGGAQRARVHLATATRILQWFDQFVDERGTLRDVPEWTLVDWSSIFTSGRTSIVTALWGRALREYAEMSEYIGNRADADWARERWDRARIGFEDFWSESRSTYIDHIVDDVPQPACSQAAGAAAIVSGFVPPSRLSFIAEALTNPDALVVRSWIGGESGEYDEQRIDDQSHGKLVADWDVDRQIVRAQPFFSYVVHDALAVAGRVDLVIDSIRSWGAFLVDGYDTFGECWGWGTPVHGWSATPTRDLIQKVLGVTPAEPGFTRARVAPDLGGLDFAEGAVPTPLGPIALAVHRDKLIIDTPMPCTVVSAPGREEEIAPGRHRLARIWMR